MEPMLKNITSNKRIEDLNACELVDLICDTKPLDKSSAVFLKNFGRAIAFENKDLLKLSLLGWRTLPPESKVNLSVFLPLMEKLSENENI
jgi:hypothetical protein